MNIESIFSKKLTRNINGVVKAEEKDNENIFVELDEYVVTRELHKHFNDFFEVYSPTVNYQGVASSGNNGVWISGFFGSGKSHFLKILSYLLENNVVEYEGNSRRAVDFFENKINDNELWANIQNAGSKNTDVILFNIDSRANTEDRENAILKVFLKVFNERLGYCADFPHIAHLERELDERKQYEAFKSKFAELADSTWEDERDAYDFYRDEIAEALSYATKQSAESAKQMIENVEDNFPLDIHNFCTWVKDYLDSSGDKNILFLVDEVGQFIGKNTQMMLKLQTITENLGTYCNGRAWVIVTSQADIDAAIGSMNRGESQDFSKIQGRFKTRLALSSSNTSEVIQKRLLAKTDKAEEALLKIFSAEGDILRHQLSFDKTTTAELKGYTDGKSFVANYPFIPYHYLLVQKVFESIRTKGATGKHLAMGERSLLDAFQNAAKQIKNEELNVLVPFHSFYAPIESFLEPAVKRTIDQALELDSLSDFDGQILKTLFLIRYVDTVKSTLDNLVTLSISKIDEDKIVLRKKIEDSLERLERQLLIARNGEEFIFLTNEEKEIENEIRNTDCEISELSSKLSSIVFDNILKGNRVYRYPVNKQDFSVSRFCNGHPKDGLILEDLVLKITSPLDTDYNSFSTDYDCTEYTLKDDGSMLVKLGENQRLWAELTTYIKTDRFLKQNSGQRREQEHLLREKQMENIEREKRLKTDFENLFLEAEVYAIGTKMPKKPSTPIAVLEESYKYVIENTFEKLNMLKASQSDVLRELKAVLTADDMAQAGLDLQTEENNPAALQEVDNYISLNFERNIPVSLRDVVAHFSKRPYGWPDNEILLVVARLGLAGKLSFDIGNDSLPLNKAYDSFTNGRKRPDIRISTVRRHGESDIKKASALVKALFGKTFTGSEEKELYALIVSELKNWRDDLKAFQNRSQSGKFPGKQKIEAGLVLVSGVLEESTSYLLIERFVKEKGSLEDFSEDFEDLEDFYENQVDTWLQLDVALNQRFKANKSKLMEDTEAAKALEELESIHSMEDPYSKVRFINPLIEKIKAVNDSIVKEKKEDALRKVDSKVERVQKALDVASAPANISNEALYPLRKCRERIENTDSIHQILSEQGESMSFEDKAYDLINAYVEEQHKQAALEKKSSIIESEYVSDITDNAATTNTNIDTNKQTNIIPRKTVPISPSDLIRKSVSNGIIETVQEIDDCLSLLREQLIKSVEAGDRIRIK